METTSIFHQIHPIPGPSQGLQGNGNFTLRFSDPFSAASKKTQVFAAALMVLVIIYNRHFHAFLLRSLLSNVSEIKSEAQCWNIGKEQIFTEKTPMKSQLKGKSFLSMLADRKDSEKWGEPSYIQTPRRGTWGTCDKWPLPCTDDHPGPRGCQSAGASYGEPRMPQHRRTWSTAVAQNP